MTSLSIALATEAEAPACLALIPEVRNQPAALLVARRGAALVGAAGLIWKSATKPGGLPLMVQVAPAARRQGVGRALFAAARDLADGESPGLWSIEPLEAESAAAAFADACGFRRARRQRFFEADVEALAGQVEPLAARLRARDRIPRDARVIALAEAPLEEVSWLVSQHFGGGPRQALQRLQGRLAERSISTEDHSKVVLEGDRIAAVLLERMDRGVGVIDAWVVVPGWRGGWPNALLLEAAVKRGRNHGVRTFRFHCDEDVQETLLLAQRCGARELPAKDLYYYALAS